MKYYATVGDHTYQIEILDDQHILVDGEPCTVDWLPFEQNAASLFIGAQSHVAVTESAEPAHWSVLLGGEQNDVHVLDELAWRVQQAQSASGGASGSVSVKSPMPGVILRIPVTVGATVAKGDTVIILESMKMENELKSPKDGVIDAIHVEQGVTVEKGQQLVTIGDVPE